MTDNALQAAWRTLTTSGQLGAAPPIDDVTLARLAGGADAASDHERDLQLAAIGESAQNADLLRLLRDLNADAVALEEGVRQLRQPAPRRARSSPTHQRWYALAASVAAAAIIGVAINAPQPPVDASPTAQAPVAATPATRGDIMVASFEGSAVEQESATRAEIFAGGFDS